MLDALLGGRRKSLRLLRLQVLDFVSLVHVLETFWRECESVLAVDHLRSSLQREEAHVIQRLLGDELRL